MAEHTPTPWFLSGVRFRMNGGEWQSINKYDEATKRDENIACVGYDPRNGVGRADALFIVEAVNNHDRLTRENEALRNSVQELLLNAGWRNFTDEELRQEEELGNGMAPIILRARAALSLKEPGQ